jgi:zinc/manganese transport system substrate-binding protein
VATTSILGDIASNVVGDEGTVEVLIPIGVDAHDFAPSARQAGLVADADLVVANGLGLEAGLGDVLASAARDGVEVIEVAPLLDPLPFSQQGDEEVEEHGGLDPHFWMDPARVADAAMALAERLAAVQPDGAWRERATMFASVMEATDDEIEGVLGSIPDQRREMVTNHEAFGYFAAHYGFLVLGVVIPGGSTLAEPSSAHLAELVGIMERTGARVVFAETSRPTALAEAVAAELGEEVEVVELFTESLGGPGSGAESLPEMLVTNAERIAAALGTPAPG